MAVYLPGWVKHPRPRSSRTWALACRAPLANQRLAGSCHGESLSPLAAGRSKKLRARRTLLSSALVLGKRWWRAGAPSWLGSELQSLMFEGSLGRNIFTCFVAGCNSHPCKALCQYSIC